MFSITSQVNAYLFPDDHDQGQKDFLGLLKDPGETWIVAYGFTMTGLVDEIITANQNGIKVHLYLDHTQAGGTMEKPQVARLVAAGVDVTVGTSTSGTKYICHSKGMVVAAPGCSYCWEGSVNFSASGWLQVNTAMCFRSQDWANHFVAEFNVLKAFAWAKEARMQVAAKEAA